TSVEKRSTMKPLVVDCTVYILILLFGVLEVCLCPRARDFIFDSTYYELAQSLINEGWYGYSSRPETMLPPGFAVMVAGLCLAFGSTYAVLIRSMGVFATGFLVATYALLRREVGRGPAAATCLVIGSSPYVFSLSTCLLFSDLPYALTSTL